MSAVGTSHTTHGNSRRPRNVLDHLPERDRPAVKRKLRAAWKLTDHAVALERLGALAGELAHSHPGAAASLREGLAETVTLQRLRVHQQLWRSLSSTSRVTAKFHDERGNLEPVAMRLNTLKIALSAPS